MNKDLTFNLEHQYKLYLQRVKLDETKMNPVQKKETKQAFFAACGQMLIILRDGIGALEEREAIDTLNDMLTQVGDYFLKITAN